MKDRSPLKSIESTKKTKGLLFIAFLWWDNNTQTNRWGRDSEVQGRELFVRCLISS
jgi:hypothetical protein